MDRRVKERLVGASILVVLVVLIVPELLSGPKRPVVVPQATLPGATEPTRSVTVDLATNKATAAPDEAASAASGAPTGAAPPDVAPSDEALSTAPAETSPPSGSAPVTGTAPPPPAPLESAAAPPKSGQAVVKAEPAHHGWAAQTGSFAARANAEKLERKLRAQGFPAYVSSAGTGRALRYRVRIGALADRTAAEKTIGKLKKLGHSASIVAP